MSIPLQEAVNEYIISREKVSPYDLVNDLLPKYYPVTDIVLSAAKYFITIIKRKDFCVDQNKLGEYNILSMKTGKLKNNNILQMLQQYNRIEDKDYLRLNVQPQVKSGMKHAIEYKLTPETFFLCLIRSKNSCQYAEYYFHVLEIYDYYEEYFTSMYKQKNEELKMDNLSLINKIDQLILENRENTDRLIEESKESTNKLTDNINKLHNTISRIENKLYNNGATVPEDDQLKEQLFIMQNGNVISIIRAQNRSAKQSIRNKKNQGFKLIDTVGNIASTVSTFNVVKQELLNDGYIKKVDARKYNDIELVDITIEELVNTINFINNKSKLC